MFLAEGDKSKSDDKMSDVEAKAKCEEIEKEEREVKDIDVEIEGLQQKRQLKVLHITSLRLELTMNGRIGPPMPVIEKKRKRMRK
uniref:Uncharacterized protein n=1 Tax=Amphimedon queenslandica TaxID=400682 RepID=A0A1X7TIA2_AMPQE